MPLVLWVQTRLFVAAARGPVRLHTEPLVLVVPQDHPLATLTRVSLSAASEEPFVSVREGYGMRTILETLSSAAGFTPRIAFEGDDLATLRGLVSAGLGVCLAPRDPRGAVGCVELQLTDAGAVREIGACWPERPPTSLVRDFRALLRQRGRRLTEIGLRPR